MFYALFLGDCCLGKQCYEHCKYKLDQSSADIRIGDLWGTTYKDNEDGVSGAVAFTAKGNEILKATNCELIEHEFSVISEGQMKHQPKSPKYYKQILDLLKNGTIEAAIHYLNNYRKRQRRLGYLKNPMRIFKALLRRIK